MNDDTTQKKSPKWDMVLAKYGVALNTLPHDKQDEVLQVYEHFDALTSIARDALLREMKLIDEHRERAHREYSRQLQDAIQDLYRGIEDVLGKPNQASNDGR